MGKKVIITGSTGMVGEGVLRVCLKDSNIEQILLINRKSCNIHDPKIKEIIHEDFLNFEPIASELKGYDACFHCMGISSVGIDIEKYKVITKDMTVHLGKTLVHQNKDMTFIYLSGAGTDHTEKSNMAWSRIKGRTENLLSKMGFAHYYSYRPGFIKPLPEQQNAHPYYKYTNWMFPIGKLLYRTGFSTMEELGKSMIRLTLEPISETIIEGKQIAALAK